MEIRESETERDRQHSHVGNDAHVAPAPPVETSSVSTVSPGRRATDVVYLVFGVIDGLLLIRVVLKLMGANPTAAFAQWIYNVTAFFLAPFRNLLPTIGNNQSQLELSVLIAILFYALVAWALARLMAIIFFRDVTYARRGFL